MQSVTKFARVSSVHAVERTVALIQMSLHVAELPFNVSRNLHPQLLVELPLLLYLRCAAGEMQQITAQQRVPPQGHCCRCTLQI